MTDGAILGIPRPYLQMMAMAAAGFTSFGVTLSALPAWSASEGQSTAAAGAATTVMLAATVAFQLLVPALLRRLATPAVVVVGLLFLGMPSLALLAGSTGAVLYAICIARGFGFALLTVAGAMLTTEVAQPNEHGRVAGLYGLGAAVPQLVFVPLSVFLLRQVGLWPIVLIAVAAPLLGVFAWGPVWRPAGPRKAVAGESAGASATPDLRTALSSTWAPAAVLSTLTIMGGALVTILPIELPTGSAATLGLLVYGIAGTLARGAAGPWADRVGTTGPLILACTGAMLGVAALALGLTRHSTPATLAGCLLVGVGYGAGQSLTLISAFARSSYANRPATSTIWNAAFDIGTAAGAVLIGVLAAGPLGLAGAFAVLGLLVGAMIPVAVGSGIRQPATP